ncbi:MAG: hypothetical protein KAX88_06565, partial [Rhodoferax sp.]|nr:hypothetical protein [Rhodoferax sp.]
MTVSAQTPIKRSTANGVTTVFPYDFKILAAADLEVSLDGVVKTLTTDYTLSGVGDDAGGNVTMLSAPANGAIVVRRRNMAYTREVDYQDQGELPTDTLDDDQDAPILMIQQVAEGLSRAVSLPPESSGVSLELPTPGALQYLRWNAAADALESVLLADVSLISLTAYAQTLLNAVDAAAARLVLGITTFGSSLVTAANAAAARIAMGAAASGANNDITSLTALTSINILSGYLFGCTLSTAGSSATMSIAAGKAQDSTGVQLMTLTAIAKTTSAWAVGTGNGGLDTGAIANSTWYHWFVIRRPDTGVVDALCSLSATAPTLPANYTQFRRIGSGLTNGSAQWTKFFQDGDLFQWDVVPTMITGASPPGTSAITETLTVPTGVKVRAIINAFLATGSSSTYQRYSDLAVTDSAISATGSASPLPNIGGVANTIY